MTLLSFTFRGVFFSVFVIGTVTQDIINKLIAERFGIVPRGETISIG
jgi:hypothetical protein